MRHGIAGLLLAAGIAGLVPVTAHAQNCLGRPDFDTCMSTFVTGRQEYVADQQRRLFWTYVATNGDWLREHYARYRASGGPMTPAQFAHWGLSTANETNIPAALDAQTAAYLGAQRAHRTIQEGNGDYNAGMAANSARTSDTARRYDEEAMRGNAPFVDPGSGETRWLPNAGEPNRPFQVGGDEFVRNDGGELFQKRGNDWVRLAPGR